MGPTVWVAPAPSRACRCASACRAQRPGGTDVILGLEAVDKPALSASGKARFIAPSD